MKVAVSVAGPHSGALHGIEQGQSAATLPESFSIQARVIQLQIYKLASSCMREESQADAYIRTTADGRDKQGHAYEHG